MNTKPKITIPPNPLSNKTNKDLFWVLKNVHEAMKTADYNMNDIVQLEQHILHAHGTYTELIAKMREYVDFDFA